MWHGFILPNAIEISASTFPSLIFTTLRLRIRSTFRRRSDVDQRHTPLLDVDPEDRCHEPQEETDESDQPHQPGDVVRDPDATRDISRVETVDGYMFVFVVL